MTYLVPIAVAAEQTYRHVGSLMPHFTSNTYPVYVTVARPAPNNDDGVADEFNELKNSWVTASEFLSSLDDIVNHKAYQKIIGLGEPVVRLILKDLQDDPKHWFFALEKITGQNPITDSAAGDLRLMTDAWLEWGQRNAKL